MSTDKNRHQHTHGHTNQHTHGHTHGHMHMDVSSGGKGRLKNDIGKHANMPPATHLHHRLVVERLKAEQMTFHAFAVMSMHGSRVP